MDPLVKNVRIFMKREPLQICHKQSNKHVFHVCMHSHISCLYAQVSGCMSRNTHVKRLVRIGFKI